MGDQENRTAIKAREKEEKRAEKERLKLEKETKKAQEKAEKEARKRGDESKEEKRIEKPSPDGDYDPYDNRTGAHLTKNWEAWVNLVKSSVGAGLLGMPLAFQHSGLILGLFSTAIIGTFCVYTLQILIRAMYLICKRKKVSVISYQDAMKEAILKGPKRFRSAAIPVAYTVEFFLTFYQIGILAVYVVFISSNLKQVIEMHTSHHMHILGYMSIIAVLLMFLNQIRNLKTLAPVSIVANISLLFGIGCILYYVFADLPNINEREFAASYKRYPLFLGAVLFALEAVAVIISVENHMATPRSFPGFCGVLCYGMAVVVLLYSFVGFFGYWRYGKDIHGSITLNIAPEEPLAQAAKLAITFAILLSYPLQACPAVEVMWLKYFARFWENKPRWKYIAMESFMRCLIVLVSFILAASVPDLGDIISLIGSFCLSMLAVGFPPVVQGFEFYPDRLGKFRWIMYKDILVFIIGLLVMAVGVYASLHDIINK